MLQYTRGQKLLQPNCLLATVYAVFLSCALSQLDTVIQKPLMVVVVMVVSVRWHSPALLQPHTECLQFTLCIVHPQSTHFQYVETHGCFFLIARVLLRNTMGKWELTFPSAWFTQFDYLNCHLSTSAFAWWLHSHFIDCFAGRLIVCLKRNIWTQSV